MFFIIISTLHVSGGFSAHHQDLIKLYVQPWVLSCFPAICRLCGWVPTHPHHKWWATSDQQTPSEYSESWYKLVQHFHQQRDGCPARLQLVTLHVTIFKHGTPFTCTTLRQHTVPILRWTSVTDFCLQYTSAYKNLNSASCSSLVQMEGSAAMLTLL
jgi:hypothetical protein